MNKIKIDLAWSVPKEGKTVLISHGLEDSVNSVYVSGLMRKLNQRGYRACLMHFRGYSNQPNRLPQSYHGGQSDNPQRILDFLRDQLVA